jgi:FAD dependent oxidoreductase TIGR03364
VALQSRAHWLELARDAGIWVNRCGSLHLAYRADEWTVLEEFAERAPALGYECALLTPEQVEARTPGARTSDLLGGLFSPTELGVNPRAAVRALPAWLAARFGVRFELRTAIAVVDSGRVRSANGRGWGFDRTIICGGAELAALFPDQLAAAGLRRCKLQMLKTVRQPAGWTLGPHLAGGLTLRHYANFAVCPGLAALRERVAAETPELDRFGIHVMAAQNDAGELILGDSHEYDEDIEPFDKAEIDALILRELRGLIRAPDWTIAELWHGIYAKHAAEPLLDDQPIPGVHLCTGTGGAGMTMAFGLAEQNWERWS